MLVYLDDILIYSPGEEEHLEDLRSVLTQLREHGYYVKKSKCEFGKREIDWVGHKLIENGIAVQPNKTKVIEEWKQPTNITELRAFLGMVNYYHKFVSRMAMIAGLLNELLQKDHVWNWSHREEESFNELKKAISTAPVLRIPDMMKNFTIQVDASNTAIGAVLTQDEHPVGFMSRRLNDAERNYSAYDCEALAVVTAL